MNYIDTLDSAELVIEANEVPLILGESGIGKTAMAQDLAERNNWSLVKIDGNLLKEGEIGGLPIVDNYTSIDEQGNKAENKTTTYAVHTKLKEIDNYILKGRDVLLFIDEINRCEHTVQQELMNLILNKEINGYKLNKDVKIMAAMNPSQRYGLEYDYQVVDMDPAQENRFVFLKMDCDHTAWIKWAAESGIDDKVIEFIATFPDYLYRVNENDIMATPRSYERISKLYKIYKEKKESISRDVFMNVVKGNVGSVIAEEFVSFIETEREPLITFEDVFASETLSDSIREKVKNESHTRLYISAGNILKRMSESMKIDKADNDFYVKRFIEFIKCFPADLMIGIMKDMKNSYHNVYVKAIENEEFVELFFHSYGIDR